ncbi:hypothetical protein ACFE04_028031 [Oxalis oulophora]
MTRKKVRLALIPSDSTRKATYKKRKKGLLKKVDELTVLCGIEACAVLKSPYDIQPEIWPSISKAQRVVSQFRNMPEIDQSKKMMNQESFIGQRITKALEKLKKQRKDNREKEITEVMYQSLSGRELSGLTMMDLNDLGWLIDQNVRAMERRIELLTNSASSSSAATVPEDSTYPPLPPLPPLPPPGLPTAAQDLVLRNESALQMAQAPQQPQVLEYGLFVVLFCLSSFES